MKSIFHNTCQISAIYICFLYIQLFAQPDYPLVNISTAGGKATGGKYSLLATIGQASPTGTGEATAGSKSLRLHSGYIHMLMMEAPVIYPIANHPVAPEKTISIRTTVRDNKGIQEVVLYYRQGGDKQWPPPQAMEPVGDKKDIYQWGIPDSLVSDKGVEYYLEASDVEGNLSRLPKQGYISRQVHIARLSNPSPQPGGSAQNAYRIISIPFTLNDASPRSVLEDDLGRYDKSEWRLFNDRIKAYPHSGDMLPGRAFFLIVKSGGKRINAGPGLTTPGANMFKIPLNIGWSLVGNPFNFPIPLSHIRFTKRGGRQVVLRSFEKGYWNNIATDSVTGLQPFRGYAIHSSAEEDSLMINPDLSSPPFQRQAKHFSGELWSIHIKAQSQAARDVDNLARVVANKTAATEPHLFDTPEPPVIGEYVSVYFPHSDDQQHSTRYCSDTRPTSQNGTVWEFAVTSNIADKITLSFENLGSVPPEFQIWVADNHLKVAANLRKQSRYHLASPPEKTPRHLLLIVGKSSFIAEKLANIRLIPERYELVQNIPNPFNPATTIRYGLPESGKVTLQIFNILGQKVAVLANNALKQAGYHTVVWDGRNGHGARVASGIYIYHLQVERFSQSKKMIMIK